MNVKTNNTPRPLLYWFDLTPKEQAEFDYSSAPEALTFFRYKGNVYRVDDFMCCEGEPAALGWDGYATDTAFSGVLIKHPKDPNGYDDCVVVGYYTT